MTCKAITNNRHIHPNGTITPCCEWPSNIEFNPEEAAKQFARGHIPEGCRVCLLKESTGEHSLRQRYNQLLSDTPIIEAVDLSVDNVCNLQCLMCSSEYSHQCGHREQQFLGTRVNVSNTSSNSVYTRLDWSTVTHLKLFGGEPTYSPGIRRFLDWAKDVVDFSKVDLEIVTNNTVQPEGKLDAVLRNARSLRVVVSCDGTDAMNQMIRQGTKDSHWNYWEELTDDLYVNCTVSIYNALNQTEFERWLTEHRPRWQLHREMVHSPAMLNIQNMPDELKHQYNQYPMPNSVREWMWMPGENLWDQFVTVHRAFNSIYTMNLLIVNPVLYQYIQDRPVQQHSWDQIRNGLA